MLISLEVLCDRGLLYPDELHELEGLPDYTIAFDHIIPIKMRLLERGRPVGSTKSPQTKTKLPSQSLTEECDFWVDEYAFFYGPKGRPRAARAGPSGDAAIARRKPEAMQAWREKLSSDIFSHKFLQFEFHRQWQAVKQYANERQIQIIGDIPIYVAHDSVDVWAYTDNFMIDPETLAPAQMAGVPPDYFSDTGQLWGNPTYNWAVLKERNFNWWLQRLKAILDYVDLIRVDHFRGFAAFWAVPAGEDTAMNGEWVEAPRLRTV